jgi:soluble lytic murein transglycosylase-like protein
MRAAPHQASSAVIALPASGPPGHPPILPQDVRRPLDALTRVTPRPRVSAERLKPPATLAIGAIAALAVIGIAALSAVLAVITAGGACSGAGIEATPSAAAARGIPARYLSLYRQAARVSQVPWSVLAAIGSIESNHGRSRAPGVRSGVNRHGCCAGPMQFNTRDGPPSTWERYGSDSNDDGSKDIYDPEDAIPSAAAYLSALLRRAHGNLDRAILGYNHSPPTSARS